MEGRDVQRGGLFSEKQHEGGGKGAKSERTGGGDLFKQNFLLLINAGLFFCSCESFCLQPKVENHSLSRIIWKKPGLVSSSIVTNLLLWVVRAVGNGGGYACVRAGRVWKFSVPSSQFCYFKK